MAHGATVKIYTVTQKCSVQWPPESRVTQERGEQYVNSH